MNHSLCHISKRSFATSLRWRMAQHVPVVASTPEKPNEKHIVDAKQAPELGAELDNAAFRNQPVAEPGAGSQILSTNLLQHISPPQNPVTEYIFTTALRHTRLGMSGEKWNPSQERIESLMPESVREADRSLQDAHERHKEAQVAYLSAASKRSKSQHKINEFISELLSDLKLKKAKHKQLESLLKKCDDWKEVEKEARKTFDQAEEDLGLAFDRFLHAILARDRQELILSDEIRKSIRWSKWAMRTSITLFFASIMIMATDPQDWLAQTFKDRIGAIVDQMTTITAELSPNMNAAVVESAQETSRDSPT